MGSFDTLFFRDALKFSEKSHTLVEIAGSNRLVIGGEKRAKDARSRVSNSVITIPNKFQNILVGKSTLLVGQIIKAGENLAYTAKEDGEYCHFCDSSLTPADWPRADTLILLAGYV